MYNTILYSCTPDSRPNGNCIHGDLTNAFQLFRTVQQKSMANGYYINGDVDNAFLLFRFIQQNSKAKDSIINILGLLRELVLVLLLVCSCLCSIPPLLEC